MPILSKQYIEERLNDISKQREQKNCEQDKFMFYSGNVRPLLERAIRKEFKKPESIEGLTQRLLPLNIMQKIVDKLAAVYVEAPVRDVMDGSEADKELLEKYEDSMLFNVRMREADRHFEMFKKTIAEPYVDSFGYPRIRILPAHTYIPFSSKVNDPENPDCIFKVISFSREPEKAVYAIWTDEQFLLIDGEGRPLVDRMMALNNPQGRNPYGVIPFTYMVESSTSVEPVQEDDLYSTSLAIPILLTDLSFACKYMAWSLIYTINANVDIPSGPGAVLHLTQSQDEPKPEVNQVKPDIDIAQTLNLIDSIVSYLLSSKGLKSSEVVGKSTVDNAVTGVAKAIDSSELIEKKKDKQAYFYNFERGIWKLVSKSMVPVWRKSGLLDPKFNQEFSPVFEVSLQLQEPKIVMSESEKVDLSKKKIDAGLSTLKRELYNLYPDYTENDIDILLEEILAEKTKDITMLKDEMQSNDQNMQMDMGNNGE